MNRITMSAAAAALLRALIVRAGVPRSRILLTEVRSTEWRSLTFNGERHQVMLRLAGPDSRAAVDRLCNGLAEAEFSLTGHIAVDIAVTGQPSTESDGSITLEIEALTIADD
jgi:hypothetical protein